MTNPYAPPRAAVLDVVDPHAALVPAGRGARLAAAVLDGIIAMMAVYVPFLVVVVTGALVRADENVQLMSALVTLFAGFGVWLWFTLKWMKRDGQSIGKKALSIKVVRGDGSPASLARLVWLRNVVNVLIGLVPLYGIVDVLFIFSEDRRCLHDKLADTIVIKA